MSYDLVSIAVTSYFSEDTLLETLKSIKAQTYPNLELIISDDGSTDGTIDVAKKWLDDPENSKIFSRTELISVPENTGVSANCNRCIRASKGKWIKFIAGDDILLPQCIESNMEFVSKHKMANIVFSQVKIFKETFEEKNLLKITPAVFPNNLFDPTFGAEDQFRILLICDRIHFTPSFFFKKEIILQVGGYDEHNKRIEDYPMWLKLTKNGIRLHFYLKPTVGYRMHDRALNNISRAVLFKPLSLEAHRIRKKEAHPYLPWEVVARENFNFQVMKMFLGLDWNRKTPPLEWLFNCLTVYLNPFVYIHVIKRRLNRAKYRWY